MNQDEQWLLAEKYHGEKTADFFADIDRLTRGEPLAYIIGSIPFLHTTITLSSHPLIPRPETEYWVHTFLSTHKPKEDQRILDLCAGSGCIGVAIGQAWPNTTVDFVEIDKSHEPTITANWRDNGLNPERAHVFIGDLFTAIPPATRYDFIVSNPPYIDASLDRVASSVQEYEPACALYGGVAGLELIEAIIATAPQFLNPKGELWLEHEPEQVSLLATAAARAGFHIHTQTDQYGVARFSQLVLQ